MIALMCGQSRPSSQALQPLTISRADLKLGLECRRSAGEIVIVSAHPARHLSVVLQYYFQ
jgi:hypothetical protein